MMLLLSPAKTLDFTPPSLTLECSKPALLAQSRVLMKELRNFSSKDLGELMHLSDKLSNEVHGYVNQWKAKYDCKISKPAILAFRGHVYLGLEAEKFKKSDFEFAQQSLRILSGLYGILRPLDRIQPHRLEMGTRLSGDHGQDLYAFWGERITIEINTLLAKQEHRLLINLASQEYIKSIQTKNLACPMVTPVFKDYKNGQYKIVRFFAKKARGMMASHIIRKRITTMGGIRKFRADGYRYNRELSTESHPVFTRER